jgi:GTP cyclohydrolase I
MRDIQSESDTRGIAIDSVGISGLRMPTTFRDGHLEQVGIATVELTVGLQAERRGTHMSRLVQLAGHHLTEFEPRELPVILKTLRAVLDAPTSRLTIALPVAVPVKAPVTRITSHNVVDVAFSGQSGADGSRVTTTVNATTTSLCPCSKEISDYGAHNQRSVVTVSVEGDGDDPYPVSILHLYELIAASGSCPVVPLLKRPDERQVTMQAYDKPVFVEDIVREISEALRADEVPHSVNVRNLESIHEHDAVATLSWRASGE